MHTKMQKKKERYFKKITCNSTDTREEKMNANNEQGERERRVREMRLSASTYMPLGSHYSICCSMVYYSSVGTLMFYMSQQVVLERATIT